MKKLFCLIACAALCGCASTQTTSRPSPERDARLVRISATWSVYAAVQQEPKSRPWFDAADVVLGAALNDGDFDPQKLRAALLAIPVKELKSDFAFLAIAAGFDLYNELWAEKWAAREERNTRIFLEAFREGIQLGLAMQEASK